MKKFSKEVGPRRPLVALLAMTLVGMGLATVGFAVTSSPAGAVCYSVGHPGAERSYMVEGSNHWLTGSETALAGTCDNDNRYKGWVSDTREDGYCVQHWSRHWNLQMTWYAEHHDATSCDSAGTLVDYTRDYRPGSMEWGGLTLKGHPDNRYVPWVRHDSY